MKRLATSPDLYQSVDQHLIEQLEVSSQRRAGLTKFGETVVGQANRQSPERLALYEYLSDQLPSVTDQYNRLCKQADINSHIEVDCMQDQLDQWLTPDKAEFMHSQMNSTRTEQRYTLVATPRVNVRCIKTLVSVIRNESPDNSIDTDTLELIKKTPKEHLAVMRSSDQGYFDMNFIAIPDSHYIQYEAGFTAPSSSSINRLTRVHPMLSSPTVLESIAYLSRDNIWQLATIYTSGAAYHKYNVIRSREGVVRVADTSDASSRHTLGVR